MTFAEQCDGALRGVQAALIKLDLPLENRVKLNLWLRHIEDLPVMDKLFGQFFENGVPPARMTVAAEFLDTGCLLVIDGAVAAGRE